ncbi:hypothetical protein FALBO_3936 [Fusarium albosuccineum]|uniref:Heterokaryon incompatibility domain-containing protein n=1 Tax=Fusarium albosuccineum TaxID=1237068 RepID=A0A8H4PB78_9HYPO|nr:hypothetical protein FALBO_3936 [Fusarium albosuccineum]
MPSIENPLDWEEIGEIGYPDPEYSEFDFHDFATEWRTRILPWYSFRDNTGQAGRMSDIASFLRSWLFFGLLKEILGEDLGSLQQLEAGGRIDKSKVVNQIKQWRQRELETPRGRTSRLARVQLVLTEARSLVTDICSVDEAGDAPDDPWNRDIPLALMVLGEMLTSYTTGLLLELKEVRIRGWHIDGNRGWGQPAAVVKTMRERWSPDTARIVHGSLSGHATAQLYALRLTQQGSSHGPVANGGVYVQAHSDSCILQGEEEDLVGPDQDKLAGIIKQGKIPLVRYCPSSRNLEIIQFEPGMRYAILSHVWADGYGNPNENKIHRCVLEFFNQLFLDTQRLLHRKEADPALPFWIDTLTIPVNDPVQRKRAIKAMHRAYTNADFMVVLDAGLARMEAGESYAEAAMKIFTSRWMGRLWTLQEAYLSKKLVFRFGNDELVDMDQLEGNFLTSQSLADSMVAGKARKYFDRLLGWQRQKRIYGVPLHDNVLLASALATLFEIEVDFPDDFDHSSCGSRCGEEEEGQCRDNLDARMKCFLEALYDAYPNSIPPGIIFVPGRRLAVEGFGWAPCTWMVGQNVAHDDPIFNQATTAELTLNGLLVRYPGFLLRSSENRIYDTTEDKFSFPCDILLLEWYCVQSCDEDTEKIPNMDGLAIISSREEVRENKVIGLLVSVKKTRRPRLYVEILKRVWIWRERDQARINNLRMSFWERKVDICEYGEILDSV